MVVFKSKRKAVDTVEKWLKEEEYEVSLVPDESADYNFMIVKGYMVLNVGFHKRSSDSLIVGGKIIFTPQEQSKIGYTTTKLELLYDIEIICAQLNLELVTTPVRENGEYSLEDIRLFKTLYFDGLTKQSFFDSLVGIFHCLRLIVAKFDILGRTGPLQDDK
ncbi:MAG: DUF2299 family protein [Nitrososphaeraceae archaeon]